MIGIHRPGSRYRLKTVPAFLCTVAVISLFGWVCFISLNQDDIPSIERIQFQEEISARDPIIPPVELIDAKISPEVEPSASDTDSEDDLDLAVLAARSMAANGVTRAESEAQPVLLIAAPQQ